MPRCPKSRVSHFNPRSPHGERRTGTTSTKHTASIFQSTLPARGATSVIGVPCASAVISIHAPRTGSDSAAWRHCIRASISIHAPRTGSDDTTDGDAQAPPHFNPRSPHGERPPRGGRTRRRNGISIHAPRTGSDDTTTGRDNHDHDFNPRSPHGERPHARNRRTP